MAGTSSATMRDCGRLRAEDVPPRRDGYKVPKRRYLITEVAEFDHVRFNEIAKRERKPLAQLIREALNDWLESESYPLLLPIRHISRPRDK